MCYTTISECRDPKRHEEYGYHEAGPSTIVEQLSGVQSWNPFDRDDREAGWTELVIEKKISALNATMQVNRFEWDFDRLDIGDNEKGG